ncbi:MarC family protein [Pseudomonadota bacterium]
MDSSILTHALTVFMGFFAVMNPIANVPIFLSLTAGDDERAVTSIAIRACALAFVIIAVFCLAGAMIFTVFGITLSAFKITGGILVFLIGFHMLNGKQSPVQQPSNSDQEGQSADLSVAVSPLALPIMAGPGTIATAMNFSATGSWLEVGITIAMFAAMCIITLLFFLFGARLVKFLGECALGVITRMMGLILAVIGTQMLIEGIRGAFGLQ